MTLEVSKKGMIQYILIYFLILWHDSGLKWMIGKDTFDGLALFFALVIYGIYIKKRSRHLELWCITLILNIVIVRLMNSGGVGLGYILHCCSAFFLIFSAFLIDKEKFVERFIKVVIFFAVISVIVWITTLIDPEIYRNFTRLTYIPYYKRYWTSAADYTSKEVIYYGILFYVERIGNEVTRNNGIFNEPGLHQMVLSVALFLSLYFPQLTGASPKKNRRNMYILIFTLLSVQSTTGYLNLIAIILVYLMTNKNDNRIKYTIAKVVIICAVILAIDFTSNGTSSVIGRVIFSKIQVSNGLIQFTGTGENRLSTWEAVTLCLSKNPLGVGFDNLYSNLHLIGKISTDGAAIISTIGALGIQMWFILFMLYIRPTYKHKLSILVFILIVFIYINTTFGQSDIFYPSLLVLMLPLNEITKVNNQYSGGRYESIMDVQCKDS